MNCGSSLRYSMHGLRFDLRSYYGAVDTETMIALLIFLCHSDKKKKKLGFLLSIKEYDAFAILCFLE